MPFPCLSVLPAWLECLLPELHDGGIDIKHPDPRDAGARALKSSTWENERLAGLFQQAPGFIAILTRPDHRIELANAAYLRLVGGRNVVGRTVAEALPDAVAQDYLSILNDVFSSGQPFRSSGPTYNVEASPDAPVDERLIEFVYQPITTATGVVTGIFVEGIDVTDRGRAEAELRKLNATLEERVEERTAYITCNLAWGGTNGAGIIFKITK